MKLPDSDGGDNYVIPFSSGGVKAPHVKRIGPAYPLFLKLEDLVTTGSGTDGIVSGGKPVTDEELAKGMGLHRKTVFEYRQRLVKHGYITTTRAPNGLIIRVRKSKKWSWIQARRKSQTVTSGRSQPVTGMEPIPAGMEPNGSRDGATRLHADQTKRDEAVTKRDGGAQPAAPLKEAWKVLGLSSPIGNVWFQNDWQEFWSAQGNNGKKPFEVAEDFIQYRQHRGQSIPKVFFGAKHSIEEAQEAGINGSIHIPTVSDICPKER